MKLVRSISVLLSACLALAAATACEPPGVGDPCTPEIQPTDDPLTDFVETWSYGEASVETRSLQCKTRTCMVYHFFAAGRTRGEPDWRVCPNSDPPEGEIPDHCPEGCGGPAVLPDGSSNPNVCPAACCNWPADDSPAAPCRSIATRDFVKNFCRRYRDESGAYVADMARPPEHPEWFCNFDAALVEASRPFCTLKCSGAGRTYECPEGYSCQEVVTLGPEGMRGSYCVPSPLIDCDPQTPGPQDCCQ